jgi:glycosyltransferase involved in cell wall biosynthesis
VNSLKIALVTDHFLPRLGGIELAVGDLALELHKRGHRPHIITATHGETGLSEIPVHQIRLPLVPRFDISLRHPAWQGFRTRLTSEGFDIVHAHCSVVSPLAWASLAMARELQIPSTLTCHSLLEWSVYSLRLLHRLWLGTNCRGPWTAISRACAEGLSAAAPGVDVRVLPNGIDPVPWLQISRRPRPGIRLVSVMRLHRKKRPLDLVRAFRQLRRRTPAGFDLQCTLIGDGPEQNAVRRLLQKCGLEKQFHLTGRLSREKIREVFAESDIFVLPSVKEAFGIAALEARCSGLPVVAMAYGGVRDVVEHGRHGFLARNHGEMVQYLLRLVQDTGLREEFSRRAREGLEKFYWDRVLDEQLAIYQKLLGKDSESRPVRKAG